MEDNQFEKRMELLKKSYERIPSSFDSEEVLRKIEEESNQPFTKEPSIKKKAVFKQNVIAWTVSIASIFIIGILSAIFLLSDKSEQAAEGEIGKQFLQELKDAYKMEREKRRVMLEMDEEQFASLNFVNSADSTITHVTSASYLEVLSSNGNAEERLEEHFESAISKLMLPSEMLENLLKNPLNDDIEASITFMSEYRDKVNGLNSIYDDALFESQEKQEGINANNLDEARGFNKVFMSMYDGMVRQSIYYLVDKHAEFIKAQYIPGEDEKIRDSLHEHTRGYYDMLIQEPYMVGANMNYPLEETVGQLQNMYYTLLNVKPDRNLYPVMEVYFETLFYNVVKGNEYTNVFDETGIVKAEFQEAWKRLVDVDAVSPFNYLIPPIVEQMTASGWKISKNWDEFNYEKIREVLELARQGKLRPIEKGKVTNELKLHDSKGVEFTIPFSSIPTFEKHLTKQSESDQIIEIERTISEFLNFESSDGSIYVILKYNCGVNLCSSLLIKISKNKDVFTSIELGYGILMDMMQSPNLEDAVFRYGVNEGNLVLRNNLIPVNLEKMVVLRPVSKELSKEFVDNATWPITEYKWVSERVISIRTSDIEDSEYDSLFTWSTNSKKTKEIKIELGS